MNYSGMPNVGKSERRECADCPVRTLGLCHDAVAPSRPRGAPFTRDQKLRRGTVLLRHGDPWPNVFLVREGWVALHAASDRGTGATLDLLLPGDLVGLFPERLHGSGYSAVCLTAATVSAIPRSVLTDTAARCHHLGQLLLRQTAEQLDRAYATTLNVLSRTAEERILWFFANLFDRLRHRPPEELSLRS